MHINPYDAKGGFHQRFFMENKDRPLFLDEHPRALYDEWDKALQWHLYQQAMRNAGPLPPSKLVPLLAVWSTILGLAGLAALALS